MEDDLRVIIAEVIGSELHVHEEEVGDHEVSIWDTETDERGVYFAGHIDGDEIEGFLEVRWVTFV